MDITFDSPISNELMIQLLDDPITDSFKFPFMTRVSALGKVSVWEIGFKDGEIIVCFGSLGDKFRTETTAVIPKVKRNMIEQALLEMRQSYKLKLFKGYQPIHCDEPRKILPMKGVIFEEKRVKRWPVYVQIKFDGVRMLVYKNSNEYQYKSSQNNDIPTMDHMHEEIQTFASCLPAVCTIDGEVFNKELTFQEIIAAFKKKNPNTEKLEYWIFDLDHQSQVQIPYYQHRHEILMKAYNAFEQIWREEKGCDPKVVKVVEADIADNFSEVYALFDQYVAEGYEGAMVKKIQIDGMKPKEEVECLYRHSGRSLGVLKLKKEMEDEGVIVGYDQATGTQKGCIIFEIEKDEKRFRATPMWTLKRKREAYLEGDSYIGKLITYCFFDFTDDGIPRHPRAKEVRDYE
jgi:hypothetical protein